MNRSGRAQEKKHPPGSLSAGSPVQPGAQGGREEVVLKGRRMGEEHGHEELHLLLLRT